MGRPPSYDRDTALDTAMHLFWRQGYQGTSLKDLENALSMRPGSIYAAFHSKEALYRECLARYNRMVIGVLEGLSAASDTVVAGVTECLFFLGDLSSDEGKPDKLLIRNTARTISILMNECAVAGSATITLFAPCILAIPYGQTIAISTRSLHQHIYYTKV